MAPVLMDMNVLAEVVLLYLACVLQIAPVIENKEIQSTVLALIILAENVVMKVLKFVVAVWLPLIVRQMMSVQLFL